MDYDRLFDIAIKRSLAEWDEEEAEREVLWDTYSSLSDLSDLSDLSNLSDSEVDSDTDPRPQLEFVVGGCAESSTEDVEVEVEGPRLNGPATGEGEIEVMDVDVEAPEVAKEGVVPRTGEKRGREDSSGPEEDGADGGLTERQRKKKEKEKARKKQKKIANGQPVRGPKSESQKERAKEKRKQERAKRKAAGLPRKYSEATKERRRQRKAFKRALKHWVGTLGPDGYRASAASELKWGETIDIPTDYDASKLSTSRGAYVGVNRPVDEDGIDDDFTVEKAKKMGAKYIAWNGV